MTNTNPVRTASTKSLRNAVISSVMNAVYAKDQTAYRWVMGGDAAASLLPR